MVPERLVRFPVRTILTVLGTIIAVAVVLEVIWISRHVVVWILISLFLALAMNPAVDFFQRRGIPSRGLASGVTFVLVLVGLAAIGAVFVPTVIHQVSDLVGKVPDYVHDISKGKGRFGFLETKYHLPERIKDAIHKGGAARVLGLTGTALSITKSVISIVLGTITVAFLTFFMLLEGPNWMERFYGLLPPESRPRWENVCKQIYRTVGGYVTGNLLISLIAGGSTTLILRGTTAAASRSRSAIPASTPRARGCRRSRSSSSAAVMSSRPARWSPSASPSPPRGCRNRSRRRRCCHRCRPPAASSSSA